MTTKTIPAETPVEVVSADEPAGIYSYDIDTGQVWVADHQQAAQRRNGRKLARGDRGTIAIAADTSLWVYAGEISASIEIFRMDATGAGLDVSREQRADVLDQGAAIVDRGGYVSESSVDSIASGGSSINFNPYVNENDYATYLLNAPCALDSDATNRHRSAVFLQIYVRAQPENNTVYRAYQNPPASFNFDPIVKLEPGYELGFNFINNHPTEDVDIHSAYTVVDPRPDD